VVDLLKECSINVILLVFNVLKGCSSNFILMVIEVLKGCSINVILLEWTSATMSGESCESGDHTSLSDMLHGSEALFDGWAD